MDITAEEPQPLSKRLARPPLRGFYNLIKRLFDILASALGLFFLSPLFLLIGLAVRSDSPGPAFYRGPRLGYRERPFKILKFRTMYETPDSYQGPRVTAQDDPRVTRIGHWLRQTKLNELPQLCNVLKGEMSLVGPRPEDPQLAQSWPDDARAEVLSIRPGMTSPASVLYRNEESQLNGKPLMETYLDSILPSKLRLDQLYVRNRSIWLDLDVLLWTGLIFLPRLGSYNPPEDALFAGPFSRLLRRLLGWYLVDALITLAALAISGLIWRSFGPLNVGLLKSLLLALVFALFFSICGALFGAHRVSWSKAPVFELLNLFAAAVLATLLTLLANRLLAFLGPFDPPQPLYPPAMLVTAAGLSFIGFSLARFRGQLFAETGRGWLKRRGSVRAAQERVLIIGGGEAGQFSAWLLTSGRRTTQFNLVGFVDDDLFKQGMRIAGIRVLGRRADIPSLVQVHDIGILVFAIHNISAGERARVLEICASTSARLVMIPDILGMLEGEGATSIRAEAPGSSPLPAFDRPPHDEGIDALLVELDALAEAGDLAGLRRRLAEARAAPAEESSPGAGTA